MSRPADFTPEMQADADHRRTTQLLRGVLPMSCACEDFREPWYAHCWLMQKLQAAGAPLPVADKAAGMLGEAAAKGADPWEFATGALESWNKTKAIISN